MEENIHVFTTCDYAKEIWAAATIARPQGDFADIKEWLLRSVSVTSKEGFAKIMMLIWGIWKNRNTQVWEGKKQHPRDVVLMTMSWLEDFLKANNNEHPHRDRTKRWEKPPETWLKCNVDGAFIAQVGLSGAGMVFRDDRGQFRAAAMRPLSAITTPFHAELQAMHEAAQMAAGMNYQKVIFETDCSTLAAALNQEERDCSLHGFLIDDVKDFMHQHGEYIIIYAPRETNKIAHNLASKAFFYLCIGAAPPIPSPRLLGCSRLAFISVRVFSTPNTKLQTHNSSQTNLSSSHFKAFLFCFRFVLFPNILRFVFRFRLQVSVIQSCSQSINKVLQALQQKFPAASKTQLRISRPGSEPKRYSIIPLCKICWSSVITEHIQGILNSLYSFHWSLTRDWELRGSKMNREWIHSKNKLSQEYKDGIQSFIDIAKHHLDANNETLCPCVKCQNYEPHSLSVIRYHLAKNGMAVTYETWTEHGETKVPQMDVDQEERGPNDDVFDILNDVFPQENRMDQDLEGDDDSLGSSQEHAEVDDGSNMHRVEADKYEKLLAEAEREFFPGS
ncbi:uncharacterized protein LOC133742816 [Rosa rugosa]|uniref:uncharacterized protein LOC133742816 n=1 Tax=Rosa rugosa TaxID=74645 RepID=UPI002B40AE51|nr:uncharacterized protein LOC133742816 [Rosa rugosa]